MYRARKSREQEKIEVHLCPPESHLQAAIGKLRITKEQIKEGSKLATEAVGGSENEDKYAKSSFYKQKMPTVPSRWKLQG